MYLTYIQIFPVKGCGFVYGRFAPFTLAKTTYDLVQVGHCIQTLHPIYMILTDSSVIPKKQDTVDGMHHSLNPISRV